MNRVYIRKEGNAKNKDNTKWWTRKKWSLTQSSLSIALHHNGK